MFTHAHTHARTHEVIVGVIEKWFTIENSQVGVNYVSGVHCF